MHPFVMEMCAGNLSECFLKQFQGQILVLSPVVFPYCQKQHVLDNVKEVSAYFEEKLDELVETIDVVVERRGMGLMQGLELSVNPKDVIAKALDNGLILFSAGTNVIRFVPPLVITKADVDECIAKLKKSL